MFLSKILSYLFLFFFVDNPGLSKPLTINGLKQQTKKQKVSLSVNSIKSSDSNYFIKKAYAQLERAVKIQNIKLIAEKEQTIGNYYINQANYPEGFRHLMSAQVNAEKTNDNLIKASVLNDLGHFYLGLNQFNKAITYFSQALIICESNHLSELQAFAFSNMGLAYQKIGDPKKAENLIQKSLPIAIKNNYKQIEADDYQTLGNIFKDRKQVDLALKEYQNAFSLYELIGCEIGKINTFINLGKAYLEKEDAGKAEICFRNALVLSRDKHFTNLEMISYQQLANVFNMTGNFLRSQENYRLFIKLKDSSESLEKLLIISQINNSQIIQTKQKNIDDLINEGNRQASLNRLKNTFFNILLILLIVVLALSIGLGLYSLKNRKANLQLSLQKEELISLNNVKDRLFSIISHDLRSPLANLEAILKLMDSGDLTIEEVIMLTSRLTNDVQETTIMLDNLLQWSKSQMVGAKPKYEEINLLKVSLDAINFLSHQASKKMIHLSVDQSINFLSFGDLEMIKLVFRNLLANAIKFTPNYGSVRISLNCYDNMVHISVQDSGIGIQDKALKKLFGQEMVSTRGTENEKGTGLGLVLCRDFVEKNKGKIWVKSKLGKGSTFTFSLPLHTIIKEKEPLLHSA